MARISNEELERLKSEVSVERLAEAKGVVLKRHGKDLLGLCPFHDDREPSLVVTPKKNLWHCLGACQAGGGPIDWVMRAEKVSFRHAVEMLRKDHPALAALSSSRPSASSSSKSYRVGKAEKLVRLVEPEEADEMVMKRVAAFYHATLKENAAGLEYLKSRGLEHPEMIERFQLGLANRTLAYRIPPKNRRAGAALREQLERLGIMRASSGHEHLAGSLVVPLFDASGRVVQMYGRKIRHDLKKTIPRHLYLPGALRGVFNLEAFAISEELVLCESLIDALTFWCAGIRNVSSTYGVENFTPEILEALKSHGVRSVAIAFDRDEAGDRGAMKVAEVLREHGLGSRRVLFPKGMDANEYALKVKPAAQSLSLALRHAELIHHSTIAAAAPATSEVELEEDTTIDARDELVDEHEDLGTGDVEAAASMDADELDDDDLDDLEIEADASSSVEASAPTDDERAHAADVDRFAEAIANRATSETTSSAATTPSLAAPLRERVPVEVGKDEVVITLGDRRFRVRGLDGNHAPSTLRVNVFVSREARIKDGAGYHVDTLDLYSARHRAQYVKEASHELGLEERVLKRDLGRVLLELEALQDKNVEEKSEKEKTPAMSDAERKAALELLRDPKLLDRILADFASAGIVGEETNKLVGYLAATSRKLEQPLAVVLQSSSAAGKSSLMDAILSFLPDEERVLYSAMTGQSLFYMGESDLSHKVLAIAEEEGAKHASYALKLLQSEGELTIASTGKDPTTGRLVTHEYRVKGPVMLFLTTTAIEVDEELLNRCLVLTVDEGRDQTRAIHDEQRHSQTLEGLLARADRGAIRLVHQNAQRLLRPLLVANPFATRLTFLDAQTRTRRDHMKYLMLIRTIALLHQYQREVRRIEHRGKALEYIEVDASDLAIANRLANEVLGRSLDELAPQTRRVLEVVHRFVTDRCGELGVEQSDFRFSRRDVREHSGWSDTQLRVHLGRLIELEYLLVHHGSRGRRFEYELLYAGEGRDGSRFVPGLCEYDPNLAGSKADLAGTSRADRGPVAVASPGAGHGEKSNGVEDIARDETANGPNRALKESPENGRSYARPRLVAGA